MKRALVIDADPHTKKLLGINLEKNGYDVYTATSGCDGLHSILFPARPPFHPSPSYVPLLARHAYRVSPLGMPNNLND